MDEDGLGQVHGDMTMGMYTAFHISVRLKKNTPDYIIKILMSMVEDAKFPEGVTLPSHPFFSTERGEVLFRMSSAYHPYGMPQLIKPKHEWDEWTLIVNSSLKNYDSEIEKFIDWIKPYVSDGVAYNQYEEDNKPYFLLPEIL